MRGRNECQVTDNFNGAVWEHERYRRHRGRMRKPPIVVADDVHSRFESMPEIARPLVHAPAHVSVACLH